MIPIVHYSKTDSLNLASHPGDGAGCLVAMPHAFLRAVVKADCDVDLPEPEDYGVGMCFLPNADKALYAKAKAIITDTARSCGHEILGWRTVPTDSTGVGPSALATQPIVEQIFLSNSCNETYGHTDAEQQVRRCMDRWVFACHL